MREATGGGRGLQTRKMGGKQWRCWDFMARDGLEHTSRSNRIELDAESGMDGGKGVRLSSREQLENDGRTRSLGHHTSRCASPFQRRAVQLGAVAPTHLPAPRSAFATRTRTKFGLSPAGVRPWRAARARGFDPRRAPKKSPHLPYFQSIVMDRLNSQDNGPLCKNGDGVRRFS